jgi:hypothetical protein
MKVKNKKGQVLILTLIVMAIGLIVISPVLRYLNSSYNSFIHETKRTEAYYAADAVMTLILNDVYRGVDVYNANVSSPYNQENFLIGDFDVNVVIEETLSAPLPTPSASSEWIYMDPGVSITTENSSTSLESLAYGGTHEFELYLVGGHDVQVNWCFNDESLNCLWNYAYMCPYYCMGSIWMKYGNGSTIPGTLVSGGSDDPVDPDYLPSEALTVRLNYSVPEEGTGNYSIVFRNDNSYRVKLPLSGGICSCTGGNENRAAYTKPFVADDDPNFTWVRVGNEEGESVYAYRDYFIQATASKDGRDVLSITAYVRHVPGPLGWWKEQTVEIPTWDITYY